MTEQELKDALPQWIAVAENLGIVLEVDSVETSQNDFTSIMLWNKDKTIPFGTWICPTCDDKEWDTLQRLLKPFPEFLGRKFTPIWMNPGTWYGMPGIHFDEYIWEETIDGIWTMVVYCPAGHGESQDDFDFVLEQVCDDEGDEVSNNGWKLFEKYN